MKQDWSSYTFFIFSQPSFLLEIIILAIACMLKFKLFLEMNRVYYKILDKYEKIYMEARAETYEPPRVNKSDGHRGTFNEEEKREVKKLIYEDLSSKRFVLRDEKKLKNDDDYLKYDDTEVEMKKRMKSIIGGIDTGVKWRKILKSLRVEEIEATARTSHPEKNAVRELKADISNHRESLFKTKNEMPREDLAKRVEKLLSTTPSEYVRKDVERMRREMHRARKNPKKQLWETVCGSDFKEVCIEKKATERFKFYRDTRNDSKHND